MQSLDRLLGILEAVAAQQGPASVTDVADATGLSLSTVARLMLQFSEVGLLDRDRDRRHTLGPRLYALARMAEDGLDLATIARPFLQELRDLTGETTSLHVLRGSHRICIAEVPSRHPVRRVVPVGLAEPLAGSATGAILLSDRPAEEVRHALDRLAERQRPAFERALHQARRDGYAVVADDFVHDLVGISVAITDGTRVRAAMSSSGPSSRFTRRKATSFRKAMLDAAASISSRVPR